jgi:hypothetical protein
MRKIIQLVPWDDVFSALCDDGTVWSINRRGAWERSDLPPIPQEPNFTPFHAPDYLYNKETLCVYMKGILDEENLELTRAMLRDVLQVLDPESNCFGPRHQSDVDFLLWLHARLVEVHNENPNADYMHKLRAIILTIPLTTTTPNVPVAP